MIDAIEVKAIRGLVLELLCPACKRRGYHLRSCAIAFVRDRDGRACEPGVELELAWDHLLRRVEWEVPML